MVELCNAAFSEIPCPHRIYVSLDTKRPGPYPCLLVAEDEEGNSEWSGLVVALPADAKHKSAFEPEIAAALGVITSTAAPSICQCKDMRLIRRLESTLRSEAPFAHLPTRAVETICDRILRDLEGTPLKSRSIEAEIRKTEKRLSREMQQFWSPLVIADVHVPIKHHQNWELLMNWREWIAGTGDLKVLTRMFRIATRLPSSKVGKKQIDTFRNKLRYLGLPASARSIEIARARIRPFG